MTITNIYSLTDISSGDVPELIFNRALLDNRRSRCSQHSWATEEADVIAKVTDLGFAIHTDVQGRRMRDVLLTGTSTGNYPRVYLLISLTVSDYLFEDNGVTSLQFSIGCNDPRQIEPLVADIKRIAPRFEYPEVEVKTDEISVSFWMQDSMTGVAARRKRMIKVHGWDEVKENYPGIHDPTSVHSQLDALMKMDDPKGGKVVILHGPPGGGKTHSILALMKEWHDWAEASVVTDSDRLLGNPDYLNSMIFESSNTDKWLMLVIEDGDEFLNVDSKENKGQDISRLLNLADGIVGQGIKILIVISTNIEHTKLNDAITRPGRCIANIHYRGFTVDEATAWLDARGVTGVDLTDKLELKDEFTLAELYSLL